MTEPDYDKLIERISVRVDHNPSDDSPTTLRLLNEAANSIRTLRVMNKSLEAANFLWAEKWNAAESDWAIMRQRAIAAEANVDRMALAIENHVREVESLKERACYPYDINGNFVP